MKFELIRDGRYIRIDPVPDKNLTFKLTQLLSYVKKDSQFMPNPKWGHICLYNSKKHRFPHGLLSKVIDLFDEFKLDYSNLSRESEIFDDNYPGLKKVKGLRGYQMEALNSMLNHSCGIVKMPTGSGKTRVAISYILSREVKTLVLVPTLDLVKQWESLVPNYVTVKTYAAVKSKKFLQEFPLVIFDECHHCAAKTLYLVGMNLHQDAEIFGFSATPLNRDDDNLKVEAVLGHIIYDVPLRDMIDEGFLCDAKIYFHDLPQKEYNFLPYHDVYFDYILNGTRRNAKILDIVENATKPCLVLVNLIEHGNFLLSLLSELKKQDVVFLNGQLKPGERADTDHDVIIATSIFDEGVDLPALRTLVLASGGKSAIKATQRIGRLLRPSEGKEIAIVHDFVDRAKYLFVHSMSRRKIFEENFPVELVKDGK